MRRIIEAVIRQFWFIVPLLVLLCLLSGTLSYYFSRTYEATATILVQNQNYIPNFSNGNPYSTPAEVQAHNLDEFMLTNSFVLEVADHAGLRSAYPAQPVDVSDKIIQQIRTHLRTTIEGPHLIKIIYTNDNPLRAKQIVEATIDVFNTHYTNDNTEQAQQAFQIYQQKLADAEQKLAQTVSEEEKFLAAHQAAQTEGKSPNQVYESLSIDPGYQQLQATLQANRQNVIDIRNELDRITLELNTHISSRSLVFKVADSPVIPKHRKLQTKLFLSQLGIGVAASFALLALYVCITMIRDRTIRTREMLGALSPVPVIESIPYIPLLRASDYIRKQRQLLEFSNSSVNVALPLLEALHSEKRRRLPIASLVLARESEYTFKDLSLVLHKGGKHDTQNKAE